MSETDKEFISRLDTFKRDVEVTTQELYAHLATRHFAADNDVLEGINDNAMFWILTGHLQIAAVCMGFVRIFDGSSKYNASNLVCFAKRNV